MLQTLVGVSTAVSLWRKIGDCLHRRASALVLVRMLRSPSNSFPLGWPYGNVSAWRVAELCIDTTCRLRPDILASANESRSHPILLAAAAIATGLTMIASPCEDDLRRLVAVTLIRFEDPIAVLKVTSKLNNVDRWLMEYIEAVMAGGVYDVVSVDV